MRVVVVAVNFNRANDTKELIDSIEKSDLATSELLVIDNGSIDGSVAALKRVFPDLPIVETGSNLGFAGGYNFGMKKALERGAEAVLIINNDTLVPPVFLTPLINTLFSRAEIGAVSPKTYAADGKHIWWAGGRLNLRFGFITNVGAGEVDRGQFKTTTECDCLSGVCILFKREVLEKVGLFDENFTHTCEDDDLSLRIRASGFKLLMVPASTLIHKVSQTGGGEYSEFHLYSLEKYRLLLMKKWGYWYGVISLLFLIPLFIRRLGAVVLRGKSLTGVSTIIRGWRDGIYGEIS